MAPEVLLGTGRSPALDWWSLGVIMYIFNIIYSYELLVGFPPFNDDTPEKIFENIINRTIIWPDVPDDMSYEAHDIIDKLLCPDAEQRLGSRGADEIKNHPFFKNIDFKSVETEMCDVPFIPEISDDTDTSYFDDKRKKETKPCDNNFNEKNDTQTEHDETFGDWRFSNVDGLEQVNKDKLRQSLQQLPF